MSKLSQAQHDILVKRGVIEEEKVEETEAAESWPELQKRGSELGVYEQGMDREELEAAIAEAEGEDDAG